MSTNDEYIGGLEKEFSISLSKKTLQSNCYFDTTNEVLKQQHSALRIRVTDSY